MCDDSLRVCVSYTHTESGRVCGAARDLGHGDVDRPPLRGSCLLQPLGPAHVHQLDALPSVQSRLEHQLLGARQSTF